MKRSNGELRVARRQGVDTPDPDHAAGSPEKGAAQPPAGEPGMDPEDAALAAAVRAGGVAGTEAWSRLFEKYQDRVYAVCLRMLGNPEAAADLAQASFIKIIQGMPGYDGRSKLSTWMTRVTMNACLSHLRGERLRRHQSLGGPGGEGTGEARRQVFGPGGGAGGAQRRGPVMREIREPGPGEGVEVEERRRLVARALSVLQPDQRAILVLRDVQGLDYEQIAAVLDAPVGTVKSRLFRARAALRDAVEGGGGGEER